MSESKDLKEVSFLRNNVYNLLGIIIPLAVALIVTPKIIIGLGIEKFGLLTIAWLILGYFGFLDFGVSRALTKVVAHNWALKNNDEIWATIFSSVVIFTLFLIPLSIAFFCFRVDAIGLLNDVPEHLISDITLSTGLIFLSLPVIVVTGILKGALEGLERFDITNLVKVPMSIWSYTGPFFLLPYTQELSQIILFLILGKLITLVLFGYKLYELKGNVTLKISLKSFNKLIIQGGWIGASTSLSPVMMFIDRFIVASWLAISQIAYYTTPMDALGKLLQPVDAITGVFFPAMSKLAILKSADFDKLYYQCLHFIAGSMVLLSIFICFFSEEVLSIWISKDFSHHAALVLAILSVGTYANAVARVPYIALQASGRAKLTAMLQLFEFPPYFFALMVFAPFYGVIGVAVVWSLRVIIDAIILLKFVKNSQCHSTLLFDLCSLIAALLLAQNFSHIWLKFCAFSLYFLYVLVRLNNVFNIRNGFNFTQILRESK